MNRSKGCLVPTAAAILALAVTSRTTAEEVKPDLVVSDLWAVEEESVVAIVTNRGQAAAGPCVVRLELIDPAGTHETLKSVEIAVPGLAPGKHAMVTFETVPIDARGARVQVHVDAKRQVEENNELNNRVLRQPTAGGAPETAIQKPAEETGGQEPPDDKEGESGRFKAVHLLAQRLLDVDLAAMEVFLTVEGGLTHVGYTVRNVGLIPYAGGREAVVVLTTESQVREVGRLAVPPLGAGEEMVGDLPLGENPSEYLLALTLVPADARADNDASELATERFLADVAVVSLDFVKGMLVGRVKNMGSSPARNRRLVLQRSVHVTGSIVTETVDEVDVPELPPGGEWRHGYSLGTTEPEAGAMWLLSVTPSDRSPENNVAWKRW